MWADNVQNPILQFLNLSNNYITSISEHTFSAMAKLRIIDLSTNSIIVLNTDAFFPVHNLEYLNINHNPIHIDVIISGKTIAIHSLISDTGKLCCALKVKSCTTASCERLSCHTLLEYKTIYISVCSIGVIILCLNICALIYNNMTFAMSKTKNNFLTQLVNALDICDILCGIYLLLLVLANDSYGKYFSIHASSWKNSSFCSVLSFISLTYLTMSPTVNILVSLIRLHVIKNKQITISHRIYIALDPG